MTIWLMIIALTNGQNFTFHYETQSECIIALNKYKIVNESNGKPDFVKGLCREEKL